MMSPGDILTIHDVAERLRLAERTVYAMVQAGELPAFKIRNQWRLRRTAFEAWLDSVAGEGVSPRDATLRFAVEVEAADSLGAHDLGLPSLASDASSEHPSERPESALPALTDRVSQAEMHRRFVAALGDLVVRHGPFDSKPLEVDLAPPLQPLIRVYLFNATRPPGGRPMGEHKIQLIVPGQKRGERGRFDDHDNRAVVLCGYVAEEDVFVLWDAALYEDFAWSRNVQVKVDTIIKATAGRIARQTRQLRRGDGETMVEQVLAATAGNLAEALELRRELTHQRLLQEV